MSIKIESEVFAIIDKYRDSKGERAFNFYQRYCDFDGFNKAVNIGLRIIQKDLGIDVPNFTYYSARKSFSTIMFEDLEVQDHIVSDCLNHSGDKKTELARRVYRKNDKSRLDKYNRMLVDYLFEKGQYSKEHAVKVQKQKPEQEPKYTKDQVRAMLDQLLEKAS